MAQTKLNVSKMNNPNVPVYKPKEKAPPRKVNSLSQMLSIVDKFDMSDSVREKLINEIKKFPDGSLDFVLTDLHNMINRITMQETPDKKEKVRDWRDVLAEQQREEEEF